MGVEVTNYKSVPALDYKYFFMENMEIIQTKKYNVNDLPKFSLKIIYRMYAIDLNGTIHFADKNNTINIDDYMELAIVKAQAQDTDLLETSVVLEHAVAKIAEELADVGNTKVI